MNPLFLIFACVLLILYFWTLYSLPITVVGVRHLLRTSRKQKKLVLRNAKKLPDVSIMVPMKNEEQVVGRLLEALLNLNYPSQNMEIIMIDDGSTDKTVEICKEYVTQYPDQIKLLRLYESGGKSSALNYGLRQANGAIIATFDADSVPESDALLKAVDFFEDPSIAAVQGTICSINADENMLTKFISYETAVRFKAYMQGKDVLKLFVSLSGTCQFIRRNVLREVGGWSKKSLSEDMEISARLTEKGHKIKYAPDARTWEENPSTLRQFLNQRLRWYRGCMDAALKYGRLVRKFNWKSVDAEITLASPFMLTLSLLGFLICTYVSMTPISYDPIFVILAQSTMVLTVITLLTAGLALIYVTKPRRIANVLWLPFIYVYWTLQTFVAAYALMQIVFRRPRRWKKTMKTGTITKAL